VGLTDKDGQVIAAPFVKTPMDRITDFDGPVDVEGEPVFLVPALMVSMIKAAHLALFKLLAYDWSLNPAGQYIGTRLAKVVQGDADAEVVKQLADQLPNCWRIMPGGAVAEDTLSSRLLMFHFDYYDGSGHPTEHGLDAWGASCIFITNDHTFTVTLPFSFDPDGLSGALGRYRRYLSEPDVTHTAYTAQVRPDGAVEHSRKAQNVLWPRRESAGG
jgi:hypothetical protein